MHGIQAKRPTQGTGGPSLQCTSKEPRDALSSRSHHPKIDFPSQLFRPGGGRVSAQQQILRLGKLFAVMLSSSPSILFLLLPTMMLRMPHVLASPAAISPEDLRESHGKLSRRQTSESNPAAEGELAENDTGTEIQINDTIPLSIPFVGESDHWNVKDTGFVFDVDVRMGTKLNDTDVFKYINKSIKRVGEKPQTDVVEAWTSSPYFAPVEEKVVLTYRLSNTKDIDQLQWRQLKNLFGEDGLTGYFKERKRFFCTIFGVRDTTRAGQHRYTGFIKVRKGRFRRPGVGSSTTGIDDSAMEPENQCNSDVDFFPPMASGEGTASGEMVLPASTISTSR